MKMISDDSITPISAMMTTFAAKRRSGRIITILPEALVGVLSANNFEAMKTRVKAVKKREPGENAHAQRKIHSLE